MIFLPPLLSCPVLSFPSFIPSVNLLPHKIFPPPTKIDQMESKYAIFDQLIKKMGLGRGFRLKRDYDQVGGRP